MKIERTCLADKVREIILAYIAEGKYQAGERLLELNVAKELGVSQAPVREAFQQLVAMKVLESQPHKGTRVREVTLREMRESTIVRGILEQAAAEMGVQKLKDSIHELEAANAAVKAAVEAGDSNAVSTHNVQFHRLIAEACGNEMLLEAWNNLNFEAKFRMCVTQSDREDLDGMVEGNRKVIELLANGDGVAAGRILRERAQNCAAEIQAPSTVTESSKIVVTN